MKNFIKKLIREKFDSINVSCAALASISVDGKYLLFNEGDGYQPIGGALKYFESAIPFLQSINFTTTRTDNDIRITIPKTKINEFKNWFLSGKERETTIEREINEELTGSLNSEYINDLKTINIKLKEVMKDKLRIFQIHKISYSNETKIGLIDLVKTNQNFILATPEEIKNKTNGISDHSVYII